MKNTSYLKSLDKAYELIENERGQELVIDECSHKAIITVEVYENDECVFSADFKRKSDFVNWVSNGCNL